MSDGTSMVPGSLRILWPGGAILGEGPLWVDRESALYWVDIKQKMIHRLDWPDGERCSWTVEPAVGALQPLRAGGFIAAAKDGFHLVDLPEGGGEARMARVLVPETERPRNRFNDGKIGPDGAFWAGSMDDEEVEASGRLYRLTETGAIRVMDEGYVITNGPAFSPDGQLMYHTDTLKREIYSFSLGAAGGLGAKSLFARIPEDAGYPDGMCVDNDGCLWGAHFGGWRLTRYAPDGRILGTLPMPVANVTSCVFGGTDLKTLFITTAAKGLSDAERADQSDAGALFAIDTTVGGPPTRYFNWEG